MTGYQTKALGVNTNSRAELNDLYGNSVNETIVEITNFYNMIPKKKSVSDRAGFRVRTAANSSATNYGELDVIVTGNTTRKKIYFTQKQTKVGVEISGLEIESAKGEGGIGDIWAEEIQASTLDFANNLDTQVLGAALPATEGGAMSGLKYLVDDGNTYPTYGSVTDRTAAGEEWAVSNYDDDAEDLSLTLMRDMITANVNDGANVNNLMFLSKKTQQDKFKNLIQDLQRTVPTSSRVGFSGVPEFDSVPYKTDENVDAGYLYCLDMARFKMDILKAPTIEQLPEPKDAKAAFIKQYSCFYNTMPKSSFKKINLTT